MNRHTIISLILFLLVICSPFYFHVCLAQANGEGSAENKFKLELEPANPSTWPGWRPEYKKNALFVATITGETSTGVAITKFTKVRFTFNLGEPSRWEGVCMNFKGDPDVKKSYDLFFRKGDNASGSGYIYIRWSVR